MSGEVIAVDLDEVVVHTAQACLDYYHREFGVQVPIDRYYDGDTEKWGTSLPNAVKRLNAFLQTKEYFAIGPAPGSREALTKLSSDNEVWAVTGRPYFIEEDTKYWIETHLPNIFRGIVHTSHYMEGHAKRLTKLGVCQELGAAALIDDLPEHLLPLVDTSITPILLGEHPWSEPENLPREIVRARTWDDVLGYFGV